MALSANDELKVKDSEGGWYPDPGDNYLVAEDGTYNLSFYPAGGHEGYHYGYFKLEKAADQPPEPAAVYELVTAAPSDWTGTYLIACTSGETTYVFNGNEEVNGHVTATVTDNKITFAEGMEPVEIEAMEDGYSLHVTNGYMYGQADKNLLKFSDDPQLTTIALDEDGNAVITNNTAIFRFNKASDQLRFRFYKPSSTSMPLVQLYKLIEG